MKYTNRWLKERFKRKDLVASLNATLIKNKFDPYFAYRLRYLAGLIAILSFTTLLEFYFLFFLMGHSDAIHIILYRLILLASVSVWWGMTEIMRTRIRQFRLLKDFESIKLEITAWFTLTILVSAIFLVFSIYHFISIFKPHITTQDRLTRVYIAAVAFQGSALLLMSTLHSSLYALRRIVRPFFSIPLANLIGLLTLFVTYPFVKDYALALSYIIGAVITVFLTTYYAIRMNRVLLLLPKQVFSLRAFSLFLKRIPLKELILAGISAGLIAFQLVLVYFILDDRQILYAFEALMMLYLISPQFHYSHDWCMLFYFDFKKLIDPVLGNFQQRYGRSIMTTALLVAFMLFLLSTFLLLFTFGTDAFPLLLAVFFIYILRTLFAIKSIEAFCEFHYGITIVASGIVAAILILFHYLEAGYYLKMFSVIVSLGIANTIIYFWKQKKFIPKNDEYDIYTFITQVTSQKSESRIIKVEFLQRISSAKIKTMRQRLAQTGASCLINNNSQWINLNRESVHQDTLENVIKACGVNLYHFHDYGLHPTGKDAIKAVFINGTTLPKTKSALVEKFQALFSKGRIMSVESDTINVDAFQLSQKEASSLFFLARKFLYQPFLEADESVGFVTASTDQDGINTLFLAPNDSSKAKKKEWSNLLLAYLANLGIEHEQQTG